MYISFFFYIVRYTLHDINIFLEYLWKVKINTKAGKMLINLWTIKVYIKWNEMEIEGITLSLS